ncbi:DUF1304 family protein [Fructobacillus sp. M158]|uniref:DUF1304 domain-containing protein n=1 Tax=Fructobacillus parabroussonetiae TaxID=2713174 RepID=UPI00200B538B|nr:DUF1304 family protein [Fructobacillus parabroussonetiae]MCK8617439.1 DUF1304 family protein [Fructobacillus parabroussonetiae]
MMLLTKIFAVLVALEFFYILYLETFATQSEATGRVFSMTEADLANEKVQLLFKNQGVYNGLIALGVLYAAFFQQSLLLPCLLYILLVTAYGAYSARKVSLFFKQGALALVTALLLLLV